MHVRSLRINAYRSWASDETTPPEVPDRIRKLEIVAHLREEGCSMPNALEVIGRSSAPTEPTDANSTRTTADH